jgi:hypothetical protein
MITGDRQIIARQRPRVAGRRAAGPRLFGNAQWFGPCVRKLERGEKDGYSFSLPQVLACFARLPPYFKIIE